MGGGRWGDRRVGEVGVGGGLISVCPKADFPPLTTTGQELL